jgi:hypothetical protein
MAYRFDLHIQTLPEAEQRETFKFVSLGYVGGAGVKGFQQLINTWLRVFLTSKGSDPADLSFGTGFPDLIGSNLNISDARDIVLLSVDDCNEQVTAFQQADVTLTPSERLASATIIEFTEQPDAPGFTVKVEIKNRANERLVLNLPDFSNV